MASPAHAAAAWTNPAAGAAGGAQPSTPLPKVLVLTGPTAVGKTKVSLELAARLNGEIISADSVQVYRGLDIGSDKILASERRGIPHHLLDVLPPDQEFSAGHFFEMARAAADEIIQRGHIPIVVGGTGFYLRWFTQGKPSTPPATPASEAAAASALDTAWMEARAKAGGRELTQEERWAAGVALVGEKLGDPASAARLAGEPNNWYRLQRVVDILLQAGGKTLAELDADPASAPAYDCRCFFLHRPRIELFRRIDARVEEMVASGLLQEAQLLLDAGLTPNSGCASRAIGYRQAMLYLERCRQEQEEQQQQPQPAGPEQQAWTQEELGANGTSIGTTNESLAPTERQQQQQAADTVDGRKSKRQKAGGSSKLSSPASPPAALSEVGVIGLVRDVATASRQLCTRQMTWFRDDGLFKWVDGTQGEQGVVEEILSSWAKPAHQGGCGDSGRLTKEEERALKEYVPQLQLFTLGSDALRATLAEARRLTAPAAERAMPQDVSTGSETVRCELGG